jgi:hypothetical protein
MFHNHKNTTEQHFLNSSKQLLLSNLQPYQFQLHWEMFYKSKELTQDSQGCPGFLGW